MWWRRRWTTYCSPPPRNALPMRASRPKGAKASRRSSRSVRPPGFRRPDPVFAKLLIANRGEIACRVARTARRLGIRTVAVYSAADANAAHVAACDEAVPIGGPLPRESYLRGDVIFYVSQCAGAQAIPPG